MAEAARILLGVIRIVNGTGALVAPEAIGRRLGVDPAENPAAPYVTRLFGIRTLLIGYDLLQRDRGARRRAVQRAPVIHAVDTAAAILAGASGQLPRRAAVTAASISTLNTLLSLAARRGAH